MWPRPLLYGTYPSTDELPANQRQNQCRSIILKLYLSKRLMKQLDVPVPSYIDLMRYNTEQFVTGLAE